MPKTAAMTASDSFLLFGRWPVEVPDWSRPRKGRPRIFKSSFLEALTVVHPAVPLVLYVPVIIYLLRLSRRTGPPPALAAALAAGGLFFWTFFEYAMHRVVFHFQPHGRRQRLAAYFMHGIHHAYPDDDRRLVMPPALSAALALPVALAFRSLLGSFFSPALAGFFIGYLCYDMTHYAIHYIPLRSRLGKHIRKNHMLHHHAHPDRLYGVTTPLWDIIFSTSLRA